MKFTVTPLMARLHAPPRADSIKAKVIPCWSLSVRALLTDAFGFAPAMAVFTTRPHRSVAVGRVRVSPAAGARMGGEPMQCSVALFQPSFGGQLQGRGRLSPQFAFNDALSCAIAHPIGNLHRRADIVSHEDNDSACAAGSGSDLRQWHPAGRLIVTAVADCRRARAITGASAGYRDSITSAGDAHWSLPVPAPARSLTRQPSRRSPSTICCPVQTVEGQQRPEQQRAPR